MVREQENGQMCGLKQVSIGISVFQTLPRVQDKSYPN